MHPRRQFDYQRDEVQQPETEDSGEELPRNDMHWRQENLQTCSAALDQCDPRELGGEGTLHRRSLMNTRTPQES